MSKQERKNHIYEDEDLEFIEDNRAAVLSQTSRKATLLVYVLLALFISLLIWASLATMDEVAIGEGKIIPSSKTKLIQNLEGGIVEALLVREGDIVKPKQVLVRLDETRFAAAYLEARSNYNALQAAIVRLTAEAGGETKIEFSKKLQQQEPELVAREQQHFTERVEDLRNTLENLEKTYKLAEEELKIVRPLVKQKVMSKLELLRVEREANDLKGKITEARDVFQGRALSELADKKTELSALKESIKAMKDRMERTVIRSPVEGIVKKINVTTVGEVIKPGMDIMEVVPIEDSLLVEVDVKPADIGFIHPGEKAIVKVTAYDFSTYGGLEAKVKTISADTIKDEKDNSFYKVIIKTEKNYLGKKANPLPIIPGMTASVNIITKKRSVLSYILKPILRAQQKAFKER